MVVGKTHKSVSKEDILEKYSESDILSYLFPTITQLPCLINSPLRPDKHPSFSIFVNSKGHIRYKDHATGDTGDIINLCQSYWNCNYKGVLNKLSQLQSSRDITIKSVTIDNHKSKLPHYLTTIQVKTRPWRDYDYEYWASYGVTKEWLKYADIYPISHKIITKKLSPEDKGKTYVFSADKYAYCFVEHKEGRTQLKVYQPYNKKGFKWSSNMSDNVLSLWTKIPKTGDKLIICSSLKDALCVSCNLHIPTICPQGEGYSFSDTAINQLKARYKNIYIAYDTDEAGIKDAKRLSEETEFPYITPNLGECKDFSDSFKKYGKDWFIKNIKPYFEDNKQEDNLPF